MAGKFPTEQNLKRRLIRARWATALLTILAAATGVLGSGALTIGSDLVPSAIATCAVCLALLLPVTLGAHQAKTRLSNFRAAEQHTFRALQSSSSSEIRSNRGFVERLAANDAKLRPFVLQCLSRMEIHLDKVLDEEIYEDRRKRVSKCCEEALKEVQDRLKSMRASSQAIAAERTLKEAIYKLKDLRRKAEVQLAQHRDKLRLKWWFDITRPRFDQVDRHIAALEQALARLNESGHIQKTDAYFRKLTDRAEIRMAEVNEAVLKAIPTHHDQWFDDKRIVKSAFLFSALSVPVSAWRDISQAGDVYDSLRAVNGNYAEMSDAEIWLHTLTMDGAELAGLASLAKGAYFEKLVAENLDGELHQYFNHPDTDVIIDGVEYQIKATDSVSYVNSVADGIPLITTSEVAELTGSMDGGYTNEELTYAVDLALGGTVVDASDALLDAGLTGIGAGGILYIMRGAHSAFEAYKKDGDAIEALMVGVRSTAIGVARSAVNLAEICSKVITGVTGFFGSGRSKKSRPQQA